MTIGPETGGGTVGQDEDGKEMPGHAAAGDDIVVIRVGDAQDDGERIRLLVDRIWPRGRSRAELAIDVWLRDIAPSDVLRKWFGHQPGRWEKFRHRYRAELEANPAAVAEAMDWCRRGRVALVFSARDRERNQAVVLREYLRERLTIEEGRRCTTRIATRGCRQASPLHPAMHGR